MAGLTFDDTPSPDPHAPLLGWLVEWLEVLGARSAKTRLGYVSDLAGLGAVLAEVVGRPLPGDEPVVDADAARLAAQFSLRPGSVARARAVLGALELLDLHPRNLARAVARYQATHAPASTRRAAAALGSFCAYLVGQGVLAADPTDAAAVRAVVPRQPKGDPQPLTSAEVARMLEAAMTPDEQARDPWPERDLAAAAVLFSTGIRLEEAITMAVGDFTSEAEAGARIRVWGKGDKPRTVPLHDEAAATVEAYLASRTTRLGRPRADDRLLVRSGGQPFSPEALRYLVTRWYQRAGVRRRPGAVVHATRHTFGTYAIESGASITEVQTLMGHASLETTKRYLAVVGAGLQDAVNAHASRRILKAVAGADRPPPVA